MADLVEEGRGRADTLRERWLTDKRFTTVEVMVATYATTLIATRR